ncbi:hypothetical protein FHW36_10660 [Chitinophaga polysaccharea]|uniref:VRR-NUC domain-containing protein n=1 Tax=Chitinophaga polysaccharea TaxID=1293035 RepID=A0A561PL50_9BACT|nr:hypothetical protein [Chitinophaga polysaccharea]TWF38837.1 hypothetical protein FHW36_10660 [Chitinophaga polysaccharea]
MKLKATGVTRGIPDLVLLWQGKIYGFELKVDSNRQSDDQVEVEKKWVSHSAAYHLVRDEETFQTHIKQILL